MTTVPTIIDSSSSGLARADLRAWRDAGGELAIHRAAYGTAEDRGFRRFWERAGAAGVQRSAYLFWRRQIDPGRQVDAWVRLLRAVGWSGEQVWVDAEGDLPRAARAAALASLVAAWRQLGAALETTPGIYTSARWWCDILGDPPAPELAPAPLWLADYTRRPAPLVPPPWERPGDPADVIWRGRRRQTRAWDLRQIRGNVRPTVGPLRGCCIDVSVRGPAADPGVALPGDPVCVAGRPYHARSCGCS